MAISQTDNEKKKDQVTQKDTDPAKREKATSADAEKARLDPGSDTLPMSVNPPGDDD